jgi:ribosomal 50S subunit-associated protein YjgA (DUF615 family)
MVQLAESGVAALEAIEEITNIGGKHAEAALAAIKAILAAFRNGTEGKITPQMVLMQVEQLRDAITQNDAAALAELREKFK